MIGLGHFVPSGQEMNPIYSTAPRAALSVRLNRNKWNHHKSINSYVEVFSHSGTRAREAKTIFISNLHTRRRHNKSSVGPRHKEGKDSSGWCDYHSSRFARASKK